MQLDWSISVGNLLTLAGSVVAIAAATVTVTSRLSKMEMKLDLIWSWYKKQHKIDNDK